MIGVAFMSDGGAGALVEVVSLLARTRAGRIILVVMTAYLTVQYVVSQLSRAALAGIGVVLAAIIAIVVAFLVRRRKRKGRARLVEWIALCALAIVGGAVALFVLLRRRKPSALGSPPSPEEVERLVAAQGGVR